MAVNIDGVGMKDRPTAISMFELSEQRAAGVLTAAGKHGDFIPEQWYSGITASSGRSASRPLPL
ncbi:MAG: hypothetical protein AB1497_06690 [Bacillota bacterium]